MIQQKIGTCRYIAIQAKEKTNNANITQLVFIVRYLKNAKVHERFMDFIVPSGHNSDELSSVIFAELESLVSPKYPKT